MQPKKYYLTTPIYYVNDKPHIGHAYTSLAADVIARFKRLDGFDVMFLTGTDEHGQKIEKSALRSGVSPKEFIDEVSKHFINLNHKLNFSNDDFIRTSEERHTSYVQSIWLRLIASGDIYLGKYAGWYSVRDEAYYNESELVNGKAPTGADVEWIEEPSYFFRLSAWQDKLLSFYEDNPDFILPLSRRNEVISFVKSGLNDLSVSRASFSHGIKVPHDEKHVIYVWLDALFNYISAIGGEDSRYWPCDLHIIGKDILRFHAVYWPAFLMAARIELPKRIFAHGWWTNEGEKISKSLGNTIDPLELCNRFGLDAVRYFLMREVPFGNDGNYSDNALISRFNSELANNIGNLAQRVLAFIFKNCDGVIPISTELLDVDNKLLEKAYTAIEKMRTHIDNQLIHLALQIIIDLSSAANIYVDNNAPWQLKKTDTTRMDTVLFTLAEVIRVISCLLYPFVPDTSNKLLGILNISIPSFALLSYKDNIAGKKINKPYPIFERIEMKADQTNIG